MKFALNSEGKRVEAFPGLIGLRCPLCNQEVFSKCGSIKTWHFAHRSLEECDSFAEPESGWHYMWKNEFPKEYQEVVVGKHRADIKLPSGLVIELQNSFLPVAHIIEREAFYKNMIWVLNGQTFGKGLERRKFLGDGKVTFRWKHPPQSWWFAKKPIYLDFGYYIAKIERLYPKLPCGGWVRMMSKKDFIYSFSPDVDIRKDSRGESLPCKSGEAHSLQDERATRKRADESLRLEALKSTSNKRDGSLGDINSPSTLQAQGGSSGSLKSDHRDI